MKPADSFIKQPIRALQTMLRTISRDDPSMPTVVPDGIYGQTTMYAITEFQRKNGLPLTGIADKRTWDTVVSVYEDAIIRVGKAEPIEVILEPGQVFGGGDEGPYIALAQSMLIWLSRDHVQIPQLQHTGIYDAETVNAVEGFQLIAGLPVTGLLDRITWKHLSKHFTLNAHHNSNRRIITTNPSNQFVNF